MNEQDRQKARTNALGSSQLLGDSSKLGASRRSYGGGGRRSPHRRGADRKKKSRSAKSQKGRVSPIGNSNGLGRLFRKSVKRDSMPLNSKRQTTRCRLQLGNSRLVHAYLKKHQASIAAQPLQLNMTMTTHQDRVELTKAIPDHEDEIHSVDRSMRDENEEMLEWATGQSLQTRMMRKDEWGLQKEAAPRTVYSAVLESRKRQEEIKKKHEVSRKDYRKEVKKTKEDLDQAFKQLKLEQSRVTVGDVNEWANQFTDRRLTN
eukprot:g6204.t1